MKICHCSAASNHLVTMGGVTTTSGYCKVTHIRIMCFNKCEIECNDAISTWCIRNLEV